MGDHINADGKFQSDKYPWCKPGFVPLKITDAGAWQPLWDYAEQRRAIDAAFADDLQAALKTAGFVPPTPTKRRTITVRMPAKLIERIDQECSKRQTRSREQVVRDLCDEALELVADARSVGSRVGS